MFWTIICVSLVGSLLSAPVQQKENKIDNADAKQAVVKRSSEQIFYGNHQNHNRIATGKKSVLTDGLAPLDKNHLQPDKLDKKATVKVETESIPAKAAEKSAAPLVPPVLTPTQDSKDKTADEISDLTKMVLNSQQAYNEDDEALQDDFKQQENVKDMQNINSMEESSGNEEKLISADKKQASNGLSLYGYYYPLFTPNRKKRTISLTAEGMDMNADDPRRVKRDLRLSPNDLDLWMKVKGKRADAEDIYPGLSNSISDYQTSNLYDTSSEEIPYSQEIAENWPDDSDESLSQDTVKRTMSIPVEPILDPSAEKEQEEIKEELDLLRYLYGKSDGTLEEDGLEYGDSLDMSNEKRSSRQTDDVELEAIVYKGVPGIFIPVSADKATTAKEKRQYLSFVSGVKRSNNDFYPYADESTSSGKWGAFVPSSSKRLATIDDYERLYRLASALSNRDSPEEQWDGY